MTPAARIQAAIECLDAIFDGSPAEKTMTRWARQSRYAGSKDRAAVRDHVFAALRSRDSLSAIGGAQTGRSVMIAQVLLGGSNPDEVFNGVGHAPAALDDHERARIAEVNERGASNVIRDIWDMPDDWREKLVASHGTSALAIAQTLRDRAPVDLRVNLRKTSLSGAIDRLASEGITAKPCLISSSALRIVDGARALKNSSSYLDGFVELQDAGSQALIEALPLKDGMQILDYCAGGGGKALALAARADIDLFVHDVDPHRMRDLPERAKRAGVTLAEIQTSDLAQSGVFDLILCDAPCSGSGAWRRAPQGKWLLSRDALGTLGETQARILDAAAQLVSEGGSLGYATCSLLGCENDSQTAGFLDRHADWTLDFQNSWHVTDGTDGFFAAHLTRAISEG